MPFTLAHPAAAVPLARFGLPMSALAVGSMAPDFPYFLPGLSDDHFAHSGIGVFQFCVPAGLVVLGVYHYLLKLPMASLFPPSHQERLAPYLGPPRLDVKTLLLVLVSLVLGAWTHIAWDAFTHPHGLMVEKIPELRILLFHFRGGDVRVFKMLQYASGIFGMGGLTLAYLAWVRRAPVYPVRMPVTLSVAAKWRLGIGILLGATLGGLLYGVSKLPPVHRGQWLTLFARNVIVFGGALLAVELVLFAVVWQAKGRRSL